VHQVGERAAERLEIQPYLLGVVADRDRADGLVIGRHAKALSEWLHRLRDDTEVPDSSDRRTGSTAESPPRAVPLPKYLKTDKCLTVKVMGVRLLVP
jgi:hypothetical protein